MKKKLAGGGMGRRFGMKGKPIIRCETAEAKAMQRSWKQDGLSKYWLTFGGIFKVRERLNRRQTMQGSNPCPASKL